MTRLTTHTAIVGVMLSAWTFAQQADPTQRSRDLEARELATPFTGITANGRVEPGLFSLTSTGVSTEPVRTAAAAFLASLTPEQRARTTFAHDADEWRSWANQSSYYPRGVSFGEMTDAQRRAALGMMQAGLSARGLTLTENIRKLNYTLGELQNNDFSVHNDGRYHLTVMGTPSAAEPWGWQFDGHHGIVNYFVLGDQVVMSPLLVGSEPVVATGGKYAGTEILRDETRKGLAMVNALTAAQRGKAVLADAKPGNNILTQAWHDNVVLDYAGVPGSELTGPQRQLLLDLVEQYVGNMRDGHAAVRMAEVTAHLDRTYFAWIGRTDADAVFYYRVHSPVILIEFDHQTPVGLRHLYPPGVPFREHVHAVMRTPNGNDYGKDLLRQHYLQHPHTPPR
ncbi:MAG: DUF3500 domain-containing protein [Vicinamibacterales bacterium]